MDNKELMSFGEIFRTPTGEYWSISPHTLDEIEKILHYDATNMQTEDPFAIDLGNKVLFTDPNVGKRLDSENADYKMSTEEVEDVLEIIEKYDVLSWKGFYGEDFDETADYDGGGWMLYIQFKDGTINFASGDHSNPKFALEEHKEFVKDMLDFINSKEPNQ